MFDSINVVTGLEVDYILSTKNNIDEILRGYFHYEEEVDEIIEAEDATDFGDKTTNQILEDMNVSVSTDDDEEGEDADFLAKVMSQAKAMFAPAPAATPFTAAITGFSISRIFKIIGL